MKKKDNLFIFGAAGACSQLIGFLDDSFALKRAIYVPLSSLSRWEGWSGSLILAGSRGHDLWWHINWAVPLKKRKASVTIGPTVFVELWKLVLFGWKTLRCLFTHQSISNGNWLSPSFCMCVCVSVSACLDACMCVCAHVFAHLCTCQLSSTCLFVRDKDWGRDRQKRRGERDSFPCLACLLSFHTASRSSLLSSSSIIDHIHSHQTLELITTPSDTVAGSCATENGFLSYPGLKA